MKKLFLLILAFATIVGLKAQTTIADFETEATTPSMETELEYGVVANPEKDDINSSDYVGYYKKMAENWDYITMLFPDTMEIGYNNTLTFKIRASKKGRIFAKFWIGDTILIESWSPTYSFMPDVDTWTVCEMDLTAAMGKKFTKLELAPCVDNLDSATVYFDDVIMSNPDVGDGSPKNYFSLSKGKVFTGDTIIFDASSSYDFDGEITSYNWDFGDGATDTGIVVSHAYSADSVYSVKLTLTDDEAKTSSKVKYVFVLDSTETLGKLAFVDNEVYTNEKIEAIFQVSKEYNNPFNPDEVSIDATIGYPDGSTITMPCFYYEHVYLEKTTWVKDTNYLAWMLRFSSNQVGTHSVKITLTDTKDTVESDTYTLNVIQGEAEGIIRNDTNNNQYYRHETGETYYPLGINIGWNDIDTFFELIDNLSTGKANFFRYWHTPFNNQALEWTDYYSDDCSGLGYYSQEAAAETDTLLNYCDAAGMYMQIAMFQHGEFSENVDAMWESNPYNSDNGGYVEDAEDYFSDANCKAQTKKLLRYIVARWAYSKNLFAWEFFNEVHFTGVYQSTSINWYPAVLAWHSEMSNYVESIDPYNHIMTTSASDDFILDMDTIPALDNVQYHLYAANLLESQISYDERYRTKLDNLSIINGEYGTDVEAEVTYDWQRHAIWNGIMTQVPRFMWLWGKYEDQSWANLFKMPAQYLADEDFAVETYMDDFDFTVSHSDLDFITLGMTNDTNFYGYLFNYSESSNITDATLKLEKIPYANYAVTYYIPESSTVTKIDSVPLISLVDKLALPEFYQGMAFKIKYLNRYALPIAIAGRDTVVAPGDVLNFTGALSVAQIEGTSIQSYQWSIVQSPDGSTATIASPTAEEITFTPDISGVYKLSLVVSNGTLTSEPDVVVLTVSNVPVADAGNDSTMTLSGRKNYAYFDGSGSYDIDGDEITYSWSIVSSPDGSSPKLYNPEEVNAYMLVDVVGEYQVQLVVYDGISYSEPDTVKITVNEVGIDANYAELIDVFPNPSNGQITIKSGTAIDNLEFYDLTGRLVYQQRVNSRNLVTIQLSDISNNEGILIIKVQSGDNIAFKRVMYNK